MKKIILLFLCTIFIFSSCKKDEPTPSSLNELEALTQRNQENIIGVWNMTSMIYEGTTLQSNQGTEFTSTFTGIAKDIDYTMEFTDDPKMFITSGGYDLELTTIVDDFEISGNIIEGNTSVTVVPIENYETSDTYSIDGNSIEGVTFGNEETQTFNTNSSYDIAELTNSTFKVTWELKQAINQNGAEVEIEMSGLALFEKE